MFCNKTTYGVFITKIRIYGKKTWRSRARSSKFLGRYLLNVILDFGSLAKDNNVKVLFLPVVEP